MRLASLGAYRLTISGGGKIIFFKLVRFRLYPLRFNAYKPFKNIFFPTASSLVFSSDRNRSHQIARKRKYYFIIFHVDIFKG